MVERRGLLSGRGQQPERMEPFDMLPHATHPNPYPNPDQSASTLTRRRRYRLHGKHLNTCRSLILDEATVCDSPQDAADLSVQLQ